MVKITFNTRRPPLWFLSTISMVTAFLDEEEDKRWNGPLLLVSEPLHQPRLLYSGRDFLPSFWAPEVSNMPALSSSDEPSAKKWCTKNRGMSLCSRELVHRQAPNTYIVTAHALDANGCPPCETLWQFWCKSLSWVTPLFFGADEKTKVETCYREAILMLRTVAMYNRDRRVITLLTLVAVCDCAVGLSIVRTSSCTRGSVRFIQR